MINIMRSSATTPPTTPPIIPACEEWLDVAGAGVGFGDESDEEEDEGDADNGVDGETKPLGQNVTSKPAEPVGSLVVVQFTIPLSCDGSRIAF